ncbi:phosphoglycerate dehydrogenase [Helicovermis profundi]|uniref:Phosphoglycerate dehydrogenase n=1 Tax=Helicovermis profundi TaxID=3065157 RepID=A0AAU9E1E8_9FIRM|nr:phosphoglycerate dehydrogenase [Clostridia bacterium S502]
MKVTFTYDYGEENINKIRKLGYEVIVINEKEITNNEFVNDSDILVCYNPFDKINLDEMKNLKYILLSSIGFDQLPLEKIISRDIIITNNKGGYSIPMGEYIVLSMLEMYKNSKSKFKNQSMKKWKIDTSILELYDKNVLFVGTGTIAKEAIKRLYGFDMNVYGVNTSGKNIENIKKCFKFSQIASIISDMDFVILTLPYTQKTHHIFNYDLLSKMKNDSCLINVSRGKVIDEKDLIIHLENGKFKGISLDVFDEEPLSETSKLWNFENVNISSHSSWISEMRNIRRFKYTYQNLKSIIEGKKLINVVNIERGY